MDSRSALLERALELFAARGYDAVGAQEVAEAAGVTKPTLYHYFGSKRGLLEATLAEHFRRLNAAVREAAEYRRDLTGNLTRLAGAFFRQAEESPVHYRMQLSMWFASAESEAFRVVAAFHDQQYQAVEEMFRQAVRDHGNMAGRHQRYAATFIGMIHTCIGLWLNGFARLDDALTRQVVHQSEHGIYS
jgi:TetR/AcrR family transcriptional regulator